MTQEKVFRNQLKINLGLHILQLLIFGSAMTFFYWTQIIVLSKSDDATPGQSFDVALLQMTNYNPNDSLIYLFTVKKQCRDAGGSGGDVFKWPEIVCQRVGLLAGIGVVVISNFYILRHFVDSVLALLLTSSQSSMFYYISKSFRSQSALL